MSRRSATARRTDEYGSPGSHAVSMARTAMLRAGVFTGGVLAAGLAAVGTATVDGVPLLIPGACAGAGLAAAVHVRATWRKAERAFVGAKSERLVGAAIVKAEPDVVIHGAMLGVGGDCDHVVLGPVVVAVETKTGYGNVRVGADGALYAGSRRIPGDPLAQVRRQAGALARRVSLQAESVVCIPKMTNRPFTHGGVTVCSAADLGAVLAQCQRVMTPSAARAAAVTLAGK
jgi:hypothetical protein